MAITSVHALTVAVQQSIQHRRVEMLPIQNIAMAAIGLLGLTFSFLPTTSAAFAPNCLVANCPDLKESQLHCWEWSAISALDDAWWGSSKFQRMQEYLRFRADDARDKCLYLIGNHYNFNAAAADTKWGSHTLAPLAKATDLKVHTFSSFSEICNEIGQASRAGKLTSVFIDVVGDSSLTVLSKDYRIDETSDFQNCFKSLHPSGIIILNGNTPDAYHFLAQKMATVTDRIVIVITGHHYTHNKITVEEVLAPSSSRSKKDDTMGAFKKFYPGCESLKSTSTNPNCICPPCADLDESKIHSKELEAAKAIYEQSYWGIGTLKEFQEYLRLHRDDSRPKVLYLVAQDDHNGALDPKADLLGPISKQFNLKFKKVQSFKEICEEVKDAAKVGQLTNVVIHAHGEPNRIGLSGINEIAKNQDFASCFSDLTPSGKIILNSCYAGAPQLEDTRDNIAQTIADKAKRTVIAAKSYTVSSSQGLSYTKIISLDPFMVSHTSEYHPSKDLVGLNIYRIFQPQYTECSDVQSNMLHDREWLAIDAINDDLKKKAFEPFTPTWEKSQEYVRLCNDDPKNKAVFLSAGYDPKNLANPKLNPDFLGNLNDKTDLQYKLINSYDGMCKTIKAASKSGKLALIILQGYGIWSADKTTSAGLLLWQEADLFDQTKTAKKEEITIGSRNLQSCFSGLSPSGRIVLLSSSAGASGKGNSQQSFAQKLANAIHRIVIAPTGNTSPEKRKITSFDPFVIFAPSGNDANTNIYKEFYPQEGSHESSSSNIC